MKKDASDFAKVFGGITGLALVAFVLHWIVCSCVGGYYARIRPGTYNYVRRVHDMTLKMIARRYRRRQGSADGDEELSPAGGA